MPDPDENYMRQAIELAKRGEGAVEPNPMVGCLLVRNGQIIGSGFHQAFGGPHAEVNALASVSRAETSEHPVNAAGATAYVTLEPCSHVGKTGPCSQALIAAGVVRVVVACQDPNPRVAGRGISQLQSAGMEVVTGVLSEESRVVLAPYLKLMTQRQPWIIAKWAMTLDGKIATANGDSQWISNEQSRSIVHQIRRRVDGIMVGIETAIADDPMLDARPAGKRVALRIIVDSSARIPIDSKIVQTANRIPVLISTGPQAETDKLERLKDHGCNVFQSDSHDANARLSELLDHLGTLQLTNVLVEGGGQLLGSLNDLGQIDEVHTFIGPKLTGGAHARSPLGGIGSALMSDSRKVDIRQVNQIGDDIYIAGRLSPIDPPR